MSQESLKLLQEELDSLHTGDHVTFQASIQSLGDSNHLHHLHLFGVKKIPGHMDVDVQLQPGGRYKLSNS